METVSGWIIIPRFIWNDIDKIVKDYVIRVREYGKVFDVEVKDIPQQYLDLLYELPGVIHGCK